MTVNQSGSGDVAALQFDEHAIALDLAHWCDGRVEIVDGVECISVPTTTGHQLARLGDWVVRLGARDFVVMGWEEFAATMEPRPADDPLA